MADSFRHGRIAVAPVLHQFIETEVLPGLGLAPAKFRAALDAPVGLAL